jgi:hypothetical protein
MTTVALAPFLTVDVDSILHPSQDEESARTLLRLVRHREALHRELDRQIDADDTAIEIPGVYEMPGVFAAPGYKS